MSVGHIKIASSNLQKTGPNHTVADARIDINWVNKIWPDVDIWGAQEAKEFIPHLRKLSNFKVALPVGVSGDSLNNPIMYNPKTMSLVRTKIILAHPGQAHAFPKRIIQCCEFRWIGGDGSTVFYNNTHLNSRIEVAGNPRDLPRVKLSTEHIKLLARELKGDSTGLKLAFGGGDMNIDEDADNRVHWSGFPQSIFGEFGIVSIYDELNTPKTFDTHGKRKIDVIYSCQSDTRVDAESVIRSSERRSDHLFIKADYSVTLLRR